MKLRVLCLMAFAMVLGTVNAQRLVLDKKLGKIWGNERITMVNKPNGLIYRLRKDVKCSDLPRVSQVENMELFISEPIDLGWLSLWRLPMSADDYDFVVVIYDHDKQPVKILNLCNLTDNHYCEVQDVRWDNDTHYLFFNMACPSYASGIGGKGSKLYCFDYNRNGLLWETAYLTSNDIFIVDDQYVYCAYGFTGEKDYLFLLDKHTGKVYSKIPMARKVHYLELQKHNGKMQLYVVDYDENLLIYHVGNYPQSHLNWKIPGGPDCFTVVYATSDDGFLNVRDEPSMKGKVIDKLWMLNHGLGSGVLLKNGQTWSRVLIADNVGYVYTKYMGKQTWYDGKGRTVMYARDNTPVYREDFSDSGQMPVFTILNPGTLIADHYSEYGDYYVLETAHDNLFIKKTDVIIKSR